MEIIIRHLVQGHGANLDFRHVVPGLRIVEAVIGKLRDLFRGQKLNVEVPFREMTIANVVVQIAGRIVRVSGMLLFQGHPLETLHTLPVELREDLLPLRVDEPERMHAPPIHLAIACRHAD